MWVVEDCVMEHGGGVGNVLCHHAHLLVEVVVVPVECSDKIKCCVVRILFVMGRESGYGERELGLGGEIAMVLFYFNK